MHVIAPALVGGAEAVVRALARSAGRAGFEAEVAALVQLKGPHSYVEALREDGVGVSEIRCGRRRYLAEARALAAILREHGTTVVHSHGYHADMVALLAARRAGLPAVTTVHGFTRGGLKNRVYEWMQRALFRRFEAVISVSAPLTAELMRAGVPPARLRALPNAYRAPAPPLDRAAARSRLSLPHDAWVVGWVGRVSREKGADLLVESLIRLGDPAVDVSFLGDGPERAGLEERARTGGLGGRARWHGIVQEAGRLMAAFDVFALSSRSEGTPIALFEAMDAGVPIVATSVGGVPDVVTSHEALLVAPDDPAALSDAVRKVRNDPAAAAARAAAARARLALEYGPDAWLARHQELYRSLAPSA